MTVEKQIYKSITFTPGLTVDDPLGEYWLNQVTVRLRREIYWCQIERGVNPNDNQRFLPIFIDKESQILAMSKFSDLKRKFLLSDPTALYLTGLLKEEPREISSDVVYGSFSWIKKELNLDNIACFVLALGLITSFDNAVGAIIAACLNNPNQTYPTLSLVQKLWDTSEELYDLINPSHKLNMYGLLQIEFLEHKNFELDWESKISVPTIISNQLLFPRRPLIRGLTPIKHEEKIDSFNTESINIVASRINANKRQGLKIAPIRVPLGGSPKAFLNEISRLTNRTIAEYTGNPVSMLNLRYLKSLVVYCWLRNVDLYINQHSVQLLSENNSSFINTILSLENIPITIFVGISDKKQLENIPHNLLYPILDIPSISYDERVKCWKQALANSGKLKEIIYECARRFRFEKETINSICEALNQNKKTLTKSMILNACRAEVSLEDIEFAQIVTPRFKDEQIILPHKQQLQFNEIMTAMSTLTKVYYDWMMAEVWNEGGITCLFAGPSGTGKTMAAEILAQKLKLPMYRIDLAQVVNKYIGETEKNLKRLFDMAEISDTILFFDEADALFGRRTEIRDAHDRYANITVSYLLERMERFKGLAILATNKKKNLDDAFTRRIRFIINFPMPGLNERRRIWKQVLPKGIDHSDIDIEFLAEQFPISGGNIRSIVFNSCLQSAGAEGYSDAEFKGKLTMNETIKSVKREYDKMNRTISLEQFGPYDHIIERMEHKNND